MSERVSEYQYQYIFVVPYSPKGGIGLITVKVLYKVR